MVEREIRSHLLIVLLDESREWLAEIFESNASCYVSTRGPKSRILVRANEYIDTIHIDGQEEI